MENERPEAPALLGRADIHMHTNLGDGTASPARVIAEAERRRLDVIAITDHDHLEGFKRVADLLEKSGSSLGVIPGIEVTTRQGHLLGLFVQRPIKMLRSVEWSIDAIKAQGGLIIIPHPMGRLVPSLNRRKIEELLERGFALDGIEVYNPSPANRSQRQEVLKLNVGWGLAQTGGSDAHFWQHIGSGYTTFAGKTAEEFQAALQAKTTAAGGQEKPPERLPIAALAGQCAWSWFVDPPRKIARMVRAPASP
ncbi:MAG TPA: CehA/McbA family metallohydrolase [Ktedonobacterales bacterium]